MIPQFEQKRAMVDVVYYGLWIVIFALMGGIFGWAGMQDDKYQRSHNKNYSIHKSTAVVVVDVFEKVNKEKEFVPEIFAHHKMQKLLEKRPENKIKIKHNTRIPAAETVGVDISLDTIIEPKKITPEQPKITPYKPVISLKKHTN